MTKSLVLVALTLAIGTGLSAVGCYVQKMFETPKSDPFVEEFSAVRVRYVLAVEEANRSLPPGPTRDRWIGDIQEEQRRAEESVCRKYGRTPPDRHPTAPPGPAAGN